MAVKRPLARDEAYGRLRELILSGTFSLNEPLTERGLAQAMGLGRMPVREALQRLAQEGLLEVVPTRGAFLRQLSFEEIREVYEVRHALEGMAAALAAERGASRELRAFGPRLRRFVESRGRASDAATVKAMQEVGREFHRAMFRDSRNGKLIGIYETLQAQIALTLALTRDHDPARVQRTVREHLAVLEAIEAGDPRAAQRRIREHLANGLEARARIYARLWNYTPLDGPAVGIARARRR